MESLITKKTILNRLTYRGKGRPRKTDYISLIELRNDVNRIMNQYLNSLNYEMRPVLK